MKFKTYGQQDKGRRRNNDKQRGKVKAKVETQRIAKENLFDTLIRGAFIAS